MLDVLDRARLLAATPLFAPLDDASLLAIATTATVKELQAGEQLIRAGTEGDGLYVLVEGRVRVDYPGGAIELGAGEIVGELAAIDGGLRGSDVVALERGRVLAILRDDLLDHLADQPALVRRVAAILTRRLAAATAT
jgi:CRP/FNR family cyclic AMP-dependent transcriptional regulator